MNIKKSLYIPIILTIISLFFAVVIFLYSSNLANKSNQQTLIYNERIKELYAITDLRKNLISQFNLISENLISLEDGDINRFNEISKSSKKAFEDWNSTIQAQLSFNMNTEEAENVYNAAYKNYNEALKLTTLAINSIERDNIEESLIYVEKEIKPKLNQEIFPTLDQYTEKLKTKISNSTTAGSSPRSLLNILTILLLILLSVSIYFYLKTFISFENMLKKLKTGLKQISEGNFEHRIEENKEIPSISNSFNEMALNLSSQTFRSDDSINYYEKIYRSINDSLIVISMDGKIEYVNNLTCEILGYDESELIGKPLDIVQGEAFKLEDEENEEQFEKSFISGLEKTYYTKDGKEIPMLCSSSIIRENEKLQGILIVAQDLTQIKQVEEAKKKDLMLNEIHHRIKNNLQVISTLLDLQSKNLTDQNSLNIFQESQNRIKSIAFIHEKLYKSNEPGKINFSEYIGDLTRSLFRTYGANGLEFSLDSDDIYLDIDTAVPCGLIINELVSNSLKYAFPNVKKGEINIKFDQLNQNLLHPTNKERSFKLVVSDNGIGLPKDLNIETTETFGLRLVHILTTQQLNGKIEEIPKDGTNFTIYFNDISKSK